LLAFDRFITAEPEHGLSFETLGGARRVLG
jgi:hypothetical protein